MMKGVIWGINPDVKIVDLIHSITPQNILQGAFVLRNVVKYFPPGAIHVGVVDPGVGGARKTLVLECEKGYLVGPDNGLLIPASLELGLNTIYEITNEEWYPGEVSPTFAGRDIFAPVAARLSLDPGKIDDVGKILTETPVRLDMPAPVVDDDSITGMIIHIDRFGNLISNINRWKLEPVKSKLELAESLDLDISGKNYQVKFHSTYSEEKERRLICLISSTGHLEFAVPNGSARKHTGTEIGDVLKLRF